MTRPTDPRAVDLYLRARAELRRFWGSHTRHAAELLTQAVELAPTSAPILGAHAYASVQAWVMVGESALEAPARAALERGLATGHGEAYLASAIFKINHGDTLGGATDLGSALVRAPMSAQAHEYAGKILVEIGQVDEARQQWTTAIGLDPGRTLLITADVARLDALQGDLDAVKAGIAQLDASTDASLAQLATVFRARLGGWFGDRKPMIAAASSMANRFGNNATAMFKMIIASNDATPFDRHAWDAATNQFLAEGKPKRMMLLAFQLFTETAVLSGADDHAFSLLDHACQIGLIDVVWMDLCPLFTRFRADLRWLDVRERVATHADAVLAAFRAVTTR